VGAEWMSLARRLRSESDLEDSTIDRVREDCREILGRCKAPAGVGSRTGLVLGQVQSGKTLSFTGVSSLARDNGFQIVIVITGVSVQLLGQSVDRLRHDLGLEGNRHSGWVHLPISPNESADPAALVQYLRAWRDDHGLPHLKKSVLITVMKNHANLRKLANLLSTASRQFEGGLDAVPALIIDDEADQASLNTKVRSQQLSTVYARIRELRGRLPNHSMLQYTATPQAPLLLNIADLLSPDFCKVLEPGADYTGGHAFFGSGLKLVDAIPTRDLGTGDQPPAHLPDSLQAAARLFLLGVATEIVKPNYETRSMLVHPSFRTDPHAVYATWIRSMLGLWDRLLSLPEDNPDRLELVEDFRSSYAELARTVDDLPPLESLLSRVPVAIRNIRLEVVNRDEGPAPIVHWESSPAWILVGGMAMDRGFTVRGLTVTYMPRPLAASGVGNADTLQQRARFFGYKRKYLGYCRVYLERGVMDALEEYVTHEDALRDSLRRFEQDGQPLAAWRRRFILDSSMMPTRRSVVDIDWIVSSVGVEPVLLQAPHHDAAAVEFNRALVASLRSKSGWSAAWGEAGWTDHQRHDRHESIGLREVCDEFLLHFRTSCLEDAELVNARLLQFADLLAADPDAPCDLYIMSTGASQNRFRTAAGDNLLTTFLQGSNPARSANGVDYPGDRLLCRTDRASIQIHMLDIDNGAGLITRDVPTLAIFAPGAETVRLVTQPQGGQSAV
jgi:hypothetical protein